VRGGRELLSIEKIANAYPRVTSQLKDRVDILFRGGCKLSSMENIIKNVTWYEKKLFCKDFGGKGGGKGRVR